MNADQLAAAGLLLDVEGVVATITLHRPERRNAQTPAMWRALAQVGEALGPDVRVVVVRGSGAGFSAGLDRSLLDPTTVPAGQESVIDLFALSDEDVSATIDAYQRGFTFLRDPRWISVAVVHGHAIGAGFQLALSCDLRLAADDATFCMKETALGLVPDLTGTQPLVAAVGYARALEICASARNVGAGEALRIGLVQDVVAVDQLDARLADLVAGLTAPLPGAVRETKALLLGALDRSLDDQRRLEREAQTRRFRELAVLMAPAPETVT
jgi:enoyl-CoA hydratase/carnithine racemase